MMDFPATDLYLRMLSGAEAYTDLDPTDQQKLVFTAYERLALHYSERLLAPKIVAWQTLYMADGASVEGAEAEAIESIRKSGAKSYSVDGVSVSFGDGEPGAGIAPDVLLFFEKQDELLQRRGRVARLV